MDLLIVRVPLIATLALFFKSTDREDKKANISFTATPIYWVFKHLSKIDIKY